MTTRSNKTTRRDFLAGTLATGAALALGRGARAADPNDGRALISITLDLEMSRHYPTWDQTHWDYEKGNLDADTKRYALEAARRVKAKGGRIHFFAVGRVLEQEDIGWLQEIVREGHPVGNHTYDHVNMRAKTVPETQFRFQRAPWLVEGKDVPQILEDNVRLAARAMKLRLGIDPAGFRTPGGFYDGLTEFPDVQRMLQRLGYDWVSSKYPPHPHSEPGQAPSEKVLDGIADAWPSAQPFVYPTGLVEIPMSPISDVNAMRTGRWKLAPFLEAIRRGVSRVIEHGAVYDFLAHPSCLVVADPHFEAIELICDLARAAGDRAALVDLGTIARRAKKATD